MNVIDIVLIILLCLDIAVHMDSSKAYINGFKDSAKMLGEIAKTLTKADKN